MGIVNAAILHNKIEAPRVVFYIYIYVDVRESRNEHSAQSPGFQRCVTTWPLCRMVRLFLQIRKSKKLHLWSIWIVQVEPHNSSKNKECRQTELSPNVHLTDFDSSESFHCEIKCFTALSSFCLRELTRNNTVITLNTSMTRECVNINNLSELESSTCFILYKERCLFF